MYRTSSYGCEIEEVEIERKTEKSVFFKNGRRNAIVSDWHRYFDSFDEAKKHLLKKADDGIKSAEYRVELAEAFKKNVESQDGPIENRRGY